MSNQTQGPWAYVENGDANTYQVRDSKGRWLLALRHNGEEVTEQQRENMRLVAAAPELLEALFASTHILHLPPNGQAACKCSQCDFVRLRDAAIAKATPGHDPITAYYTDRANGHHAAKAP